MQLSRLFPVLALLILIGHAIGQTPVPATVSDTLPSMLFGGGTSWNRGNSYPYAANNHIAIRIGSSSWYSWTEVATPVATVAPGSSPLPSTLTTGGAWVAAQNSTGSVSLVNIVQAGFSTVQATSTTAPAFTCSFGVAIRLGKTNIFAFPYIKAGNAATGGSNGALATFIVQPGISILYGFGKKN